MPVCICCTVCVLVAHGFNDRGCCRRHPRFSAFLFRYGPYGLVSGYMYRFSGHILALTLDSLLAVRFEFPLGRIRRQNSSDSQHRTGHALLLEG
jgi:hypothetical protein